MTTESPRTHEFAIGPGGGFAFLQGGGSADGIKQKRYGKRNSWSSASGISFGDLPSRPSSSRNIFKNLKSKNGPKAVPDSPTASATTGSHGSPFGSGNDSPFGSGGSSPRASGSGGGPFGAGVDRFYRSDDSFPAADLGIPASETFGDV